MTAPLTALAAAARTASRILASASAERRQAVILAVADGLLAAKAEILKANMQDCEAASTAGLSAALISRLRLDEPKFQSAVASMRAVALLPDPLGAVQIHRELDQGLILRRITCPIGVIGVVFEARPDALIQIAALVMKSGNAALLKGGQEAQRSFAAIMLALHQSLRAEGLDPALLVGLTSRSEVQELLALDSYVDLIIPRGSNQFVRYVQNHTRIPVLGHADGLCHLYIDTAADIEMALSIAVDAKTDYPAACNAIETLLIHCEIAPKMLPQLAARLRERGVELRGDAAACSLVPMTPATADDWCTEYGELILAIKIVASLTAAIDHIATYGSGHTEAIVTEDAQAADRFLKEVDAAGVYHNCSTRFADGLRYGLGAEVGISTQKIPPRGPVGLEGLVTYKYLLVGNGHLVSMYAKTGGRVFTHRDLD